VLPWAEHEALVSRLEAASVEFALAPVTRFAGRAGEQRTFFLRDPCGNFLEFKTFKEPERLFESDLERYV
jgi:extradiol dioxygenase family protein